MSKILLGVTGSVAATLTKKLVHLLQEHGHIVWIVATKASFYFWKNDDETIDVFTEEDEWPGEGYTKNQPICHIALKEWADIFLIAPLTANTLAKIAQGLSDNLITSVARAWPQTKPLVVAPAMNTQMWINHITSDHMWMIRNHYQTHVIEPIEKVLACGEVGVGAMADLSVILEKIRQVTSQKIIKEDD